MAIKSNDRILVLEKVDPKSDIGLIDARIFEGKNNLRISMDTTNCLWTFRYEHGTVPPPLRGKFTSFVSAFNHAELYFKNKNIKIIDVID